MPERVGQRFLEVHMHEKTPLLSTNDVTYVYKLTSSIQNAINISKLYTLWFRLWKDNYLWWDKDNIFYYLYNVGCAELETQNQAFSFRLKKHIDWTKHSILVHSFQRFLLLPIYLFSSTEIFISNLRKSQNYPEIFNIQTQNKQRQKKSFQTWLLCVKYSRHNSHRIEVLPRAPLRPRVLAEVQVSKQSNLERCAFVPHPEIVFRRRAQRRHRRSSTAIGWHDGGGDEQGEMYESPPLRHWDCWS